MNKSLGKGLQALIKSQSTIVENAMEDGIDLDLIIPNHHQPRQVFDESILEDLTKSIREKGVLQPITVRELNGGKFEIIAGERRFRASKNIGLKKIPAYILDVRKDEDMLEMALIENIQREDLNVIEEAEGYKRLIDEFSYDQEQVAKFIGKSRSHITNSLRLLSLPSEVIEFIKDNKLSPGHAKILVGLENCLSISKKIISKKLSVRQTENLVRAYKTPSKKLINNKDPNIRLLEQNLAEKIGLDVEIKNKKNNKGKIIFSYKELDQLNRIIETIKKNY